MYFPTLLTVLVCVLTHQSMEYSTVQDRWENLLFQVLTTRDHSRVSWCSGKNSGSWQSQSTGTKLGVCLRVMHRKEEEEKTQRWRFTCINMSHLNSFLSGEQQRQMGAILLRLYGDGGKKKKNKNPMHFREVYLKLLENILPRALCPAMADTKKIWYILLILWQLATPVWVFLHAARSWCSQVRQPHKVRSHYILFLVKEIIIWSPKNTDCSFLGLFRCWLKSTSCVFGFVLSFFFFLFCTSLLRHPDGGTTPLHYCPPTTTTTDLCLTPDPVSHIPIVVQANPPSLFPTLPLYWPGWD